MTFGEISSVTARIRELRTELSEIQAALDHLDGHDMGDSTAILYRYIAGRIADIAKNLHALTEREKSTPAYDISAGVKSPSRNTPFGS